MAKDDPKAAATKEDIALLMGMMGDMMDKQNAAIENLEERITRHFDVAIEDARTELIGAYKGKVSLLEDKTADHGRRITRLEQRTGIAL